MTYSGVLMLVVCAAAARVVLRGARRKWPALVMPALVVALALTLGAQRLDWHLDGGRDCFCPEGFPGSPGPGCPSSWHPCSPSHRDGHRSNDVDRSTSKDPANQDRTRHARDRRAHHEDFPLTGVGPNMVPRVYAKISVPIRGQRSEPAPAQRAAADCGGAWHARARRSGVVHRHADSRRSSACSAAAAHRVLATGGAGRRGRDARPRDCSSTTSATPNS